ncbi:MAG: SMC-Scp complex subunit ScpB [Terracidiphilus sp.]
MSLKAKLEAVIYAAEEPVTLAQLAALFAAEALAYKAERDAALPAAEPQPLLAEGLEYLGLEQSQAGAPAPAPAPAPVAEPEAEAAEAEENAPDADATTGPGADLPAEAGDSEAEAKREARQRDRDVKAILRQVLDEIMASYAQDDRGIEMREIAGGYRMATKPECHDAVRLFIKSLKPPMKLSLPALETLAVVAYKQPVTAPEVNEIRGVESAGVLGSLLSRKLISTAGRKQVIGRPILYKTTKEFLLRFGLKDLAELPSMEEFEKMAAMELNEGPGAVTEEVESGFEHVPDVGLELDEDAPEDAEDTPDSSEREVKPSADSAELAGATSEAGAESHPAEPAPDEGAETETQSHD